MRAVLQATRSPSALQFLLIVLLSISVIFHFATDSLRSTRLQQEISSLESRVLELEKLQSRGSEQ